MRKNKNWKIEGGNKIKPFLFLHQKHEKVYIERSTSSSDLSLMEKKCKNSKGVKTLDPKFLICFCLLLSLAAVVHLNLRAGSTVPVPVCTVSPGLWVNKADTY